MQRTADEDLPLRAAHLSRSGRSRTLVLALCALLALPGCRALAGSAGSLASAPSVSFAGPGGLAPASRAIGLGPGLGPYLLLLGPVALPLWITFELLDAIVFTPLGKIAEALGRTLRRSDSPPPPRRPSPPARSVSPPAADEPELQAPRCTHGWPVAGVGDVPARPCATCERLVVEPEEAAPAPPRAEGVTSTSPSLGLEAGAADRGDAR